MDEAIVTNTGRGMAYYVDPIPVPYKSIYGYQKHGFNVYLLAPGETFSRGMRKYGFIKEERVGDENGNVVTVVFYSRMDEWRDSGKLRFFASPEALLIAMGKTPIVNRGNTDQAKAKLDRLGHQSPNATPPMMYLGNVELNPQALPDLRGAPLLALPSPLLDEQAIIKAVTDKLTEGFREIAANRAAATVSAPKKKAKKAKKAKTTSRASAKKAVKKKAKKSKR